MTRYRYNLAPLGRFILSSYIPNIRPQIDLNLFMSIFRKIPPLAPSHNLVIRNNVIFQDCNKPP